LKNANTTFIHRNYCTEFIEMLEEYYNTYSLYNLEQLFILIYRNQLKKTVGKFRKQKKVDNYCNVKVNRYFSAFVKQEIVVRLKFCVCEIKKQINFEIWV